MSKIEWTDATWNVTTGCTRASSGCDHCYAVAMTRRLEAMGRPEYAGLTTAKHFNGQVRLHPERLREPTRWKRPRRVFVNSMSDLFHSAVPFSFIDQVLAAVLLCPQHTFQILTKRPQRAAEYFHRLAAAADPQRGGNTLRQARAQMLGQAWPLPNVWLGTSIENQAAADERVPELLKCPAAVLFVSAEPLLGPIDLMQWMDPTGACCGSDPEFQCSKCPAAESWRYAHADENGLNEPSLGWVICGGESGRGARPMHPDWARSLRDQSAEAGVPFLFKQWGEYRPAAAADRSLYRIDRAGRDVTGLLGLHDEADATLAKVGKKAAGRLLDGRLHDEFPATPCHA